MRTTTRSLIPALQLGRRRLRQVGEVGPFADLELDPLRAGTPEGVAADHVAQDEDDVATDVGARGDDQEAEAEQGGRGGARRRMRRSRRTSEMVVRRATDAISVPWTVARVRAVPSVSV